MECVALLEEIGGSWQNMRGLYKASPVGSEVVSADVRSPPATGVYLLQNLSTLTSINKLHANSPPASTHIRISKNKIFPSRCNFSLLWKPVHRSGWSAEARNKTLFRVSSQWQGSTRCTYLNRLPGNCGEKRSDSRGEGGGSRLFRFKNICSSFFFQLQLFYKLIHTQSKLQIYYWDPSNFHDSGREESGCCAASGSTSLSFLEVLTKLDCKRGRGLPTIVLNDQRNCCLIFLGGGGWCLFGGHACCSQLAWLLLSKDNSAVIQIPNMSTMLLLDLPWEDTVWMIFS